MGGSGDGGGRKRVRLRSPSLGSDQEQLAEAVDLNIRTVQKIEAGDVNILLTTVLRIQKALRWDCARLIYPVVRKSWIIRP